MPDAGADCLRELIRHRVPFMCGQSIAQRIERTRTSDDSSHLKALPAPSPNAWIIIFKNRKLQAPFHAPGNSFPDPRTSYPVPQELQSPYLDIQLLSQLHNSASGSKFLLRTYSIEIWHEVAPSTHLLWLGQPAALVFPVYLGNHPTWKYTKYPQVNIYISH
jgi:hypothetical protein